MAMPYPEGEVYFRRSTLRLAGFNPDDLRDFTSHVLIEYIYNRNAGIGGHYRSYTCHSMNGKYKAVFPSSINVMFSHESDGRIKRAVSIDPCNNAKDYQDSEKGGVDKVLIRPVHVKPEERFMFIDMVVPIRAIYLPLAQKVDNVIPDLCTYVMIDFRFRKGVWMVSPPGLDTPTREMEVIKMRMEAAGDDLEKQIKLMEERDKLARQAERGPFEGTVGSENLHYAYQKFSYKEGLGLQSHKMLEIDLRGVYNLLILPRQLRCPTKGLYEPASQADVLIRKHEYRRHNTNNYKYEINSVDFMPYLDYTQVIHDHFGVDVVWQPYEYKPEAASLISKMFTIAGTAGLSFIPIVGPLVSTGFSIFMEAVNDPEGFKVNNILKLDDGVLTAIVATGMAISDNLPAGRGKKLGWQGALSAI